MHIGKNSISAMHTTSYIRLSMSTSDPKLYTEFWHFPLSFYLWLDKSSHQRCSVKKGVLRNYAKITGKHLCQRLFCSVQRTETLLFCPEAFCDRRPLDDCFWLDSIDSRFKRHLDNKSKVRFHNQRVCESKCRRTKTVDKDILIT